MLVTVGTQRVNKGENTRPTAILTNELHMSCNKKLKVCNASSLHLSECCILKCFI